MKSTTIHFIIFGNRLTSDVCRCLISWQKLIHHGFNFELWDDEKTLNFISNKYSFALNAFLDSRNLAEKADIARYLIIYHFGGYYIDWDVELLCIDEFLKLHNDNLSGFLIQDMSNMTIAPELFFALPRERFLLVLTKNIASIYVNEYRDSLTTPFYSGPHRMREVFYFFQKKTRQNIVGVKDVFLYDYEELKIGVSKKLINKACLHNWIHSWL